MIYDFEFADEFARDYGLMLCNFDGGNDFETINIGAEINFNPVTARHGSIQYITDTSYDSVIEFTLQTAKKDCTLNNPYFTEEECRSLTRWLNRKENHLLHLIGDDELFDNVWFEGTFNVNAIKFNERIVGFELHFISNRPYAIRRCACHFVANDTNGYTYDFEDLSDDIGYIYPHTLEIKCLAPTTSDAPLVITNHLENRSTKIANCKTNEIITFTDVLSISTNMEDHTIQDDFNYQFFRIANLYNNRINTIEVSHPCEITFEYYQAVKGVGL